MKKMVLSGLTLFFLAVILPGCEKADIITVKLDGDRTIGLVRGQVLKLELDSNPTTGYSWEITGLSGKDVLRQIGKTWYVRKGDLLGSGGYQLYRFEGLKKGTAVIKFEYRRPWEKDQKADKAHTVRVIVT